MKSRILLSRLNIYPIIVILTLFKIFFSTTFLFAESFSIKNIEISKKFNMNFQKNEVLDEGFKIAFQDLISNITKSNEQNEFKNLSLSNIKTIIDSFSIKEEKFINNIENHKENLSNKLPLFKPWVSGFKGSVSALPTYLLNVVKNKLSISWPKVLLSFIKGNILS